MPKLRHIAIAAENPEAMADFYKNTFDFVEVGRPNGVLADGVFLSDGTLNMAILKFKNVDQLGKGLDYVGIHHFGVLVDDIDPYMKKLEELGAPCFMKQDPNAKMSFFETKFRGPDGVVFDVSEHPWVGAAPENVEEVKLKVAEPAE